MNTDFNLPGINWENESCCHKENHIESKLLSCFQENFLFQHVNKPTHSRGEQTETLIYLIISNDPSLVSEIIHKAPIGLSHHHLLSLSIEIGIPYCRPQPTTRLILNKRDYSGMRKYMQEIDWQSHFKEEEDSNIWSKNLEAKINEARRLTKAHIPKLVQRQPFMHQTLSLENSMTKERHSDITRIIPLLKTRKPTISTGI